MPNPGRRGSGRRPSSDPKAPWAPAADGLRGKRRGDPALRAARDTDPNHFPGAMVTFDNTARTPGAREVLLARVWDYEYLGDSRLVDVAVQRLRAKIELDPAKLENSKVEFRIKAASIAPSTAHESVGRRAACVVRLDSAERAAAIAEVIHEDTGLPDEASRLLAVALAFARNQALARGALARGNGVAAPDGDDWLIGRGIAYAGGPARLTARLRRAARRQPRTVGAAADLGHGAERRHRRQGTGAQAPPGNLPQPHPCHESVGPRTGCPRRPGPAPGCCARAAPRRPAA